MIQRITRLRNKYSRIADLYATRAGSWQVADNVGIPMGRCLWTPESLPPDDLEEEPTYEQPGRRQDPHQSTAGSGHGGNGGVKLSIMGRSEGRHEKDKAPRKRPE